MLSFPCVTWQILNWYPYPGKGSHFWVHACVSVSYVCVFVHILHVALYMYPPILNYCRCLGFRFSPLTWRGVPECNKKPEIQIFFLQCFSLWFFIDIDYMQVELCILSMLVIDSAEIPLYSDNAEHYRLPWNWIHCDDCVLGFDSGFSIEGPSQAKIDCKDNNDGSADVSYWPTAPGEYAVHILCDEEDIPNSPYMAQIQPQTDLYNPTLVRTNFLPKIQVLQQLFSFPVIKHTAQWDFLWTRNNVLL